MPKKDGDMLSICRYVTRPENTYCLTCISLAHSLAFRECDRLTDDFMFHVREWIFQPYLLTYHIRRFSILYPRFYFAKDFFLHKFIYLCFYLFSFPLLSRGNRHVSFLIVIFPVSSGLTHYLSLPACLSSL